MENLIDFIFGNIFWLAIVVGGIISWFGRVMGGEDERETTRMPSGPLKPQAEKNPTQSESDSSPQSAGEGRLREYYEKKRETLSHIKNKDEIGGGSSYETPKQDILNGVEETAPTKQYKRSHPKPYKPVAPLDTKNWDRKRLADGIVMAEILGPPRAHKPHRSHPRKR